MKKNTKQLIAEMQKLLGTNKHTLNETVYDSMEPAPWETNNPGYDGNFGAYDEEEYVKQAQDPANAEVVQIINQIRQVALQGIAKLANNPESPLYDTLKKVWQLIDKTVETKDEETVKETYSRKNRRPIYENDLTYPFENELDQPWNNKKECNAKSALSFVRAFFGDFGDYAGNSKGSIFNPKDRSRCVSQLLSVYDISRDLAINIVERYYQQEKERQEKEEREDYQLRPGWKRVGDYMIRNK